MQKLYRLAESGQGDAFLYSLSQFEVICVSSAPITFTTTEPIKMLIGLSYTKLACRAMRWSRKVSLYMLMKPLVLFSVDCTLSRPPLLIRSGLPIEKLVKNTSVPLVLFIKQMLLSLQLEQEDRGEPVFGKNAFCGTLQKDSEFCPRWHSGTV